MAGFTVTTSGGIRSTETGVGGKRPAGLVVDSSQDSTSPIVSASSPRNRALRDWRSVYDYSVVGNGTSDDTANLLLATEDCRNTGRKLHVPAGTFLVSASITNGANTKPLYMEGLDPENCVFKQAAGFAAAAVVLCQGAGFGAAQAISSPAAAGATVITGIASTAGWAQNDIILIRGNDQAINGNAGGGTKGTCSLFGEYAKIKSVDSASQVTVYGRLEAAYTATNTDLRKLTAIGGHVAGVGFLNNAPGTQSVSARGVQFNFFNGVELDHLAFTDMDADCVLLQQGIDFRVSDPNFLQTHDLETGNNPYCIQAAKACHHGIVEGPRSRYGRHLFTTEGVAATEVGQAHILVVNGNATEHSLAAFDTHPGARKITFANCLVHNQYPGLPTTPAFQIRGPDSDVISPIITGSNIGVQFIFGADRARLTGGRIMSTPIGVNVESSDDCYVGGGLLIDNPATVGVQFTIDAGWTMGTGATLGEFTVTGSPASGQVTNTAATTLRRAVAYSGSLVVQPQTTGTSTGFTAGAGTAVQDASTFTGGLGSTAYRVSDVVLALKQLGLLKQ